MTSLPEQFFAARKWPLEVQIDFFRAVTAQVFESAEQVIALNIDASRSAVERSSRAVKQLMSINDPRDLFALGSQGQEQFQQMVAYSRELFSIAAGAQASLARQQGGAQAQAAPTAQAAPAQATPAQERPASAADEAEQQAQGVKPSRKPVVATATATEPEAHAAPKAKPIAKAAGKLASKSAATQHPLASPVVLEAGEVELPPVKPVEAAKPPAPVAGTPGIESKQAQLATLKGERKK